MPVSQRQECFNLCGRTPFALALGRRQPLIGAAEKNNPRSLLKTSPKFQQVASGLSAWRGAALPEGSSVIWQQAAPGSGPAVSLACLILDDSFGPAF